MDQTTAAAPTGPTPAQEAVIQITWELQILYYFFFFFGGAIIWSWLTSVPSEIKYIFVPEIRKALNGKMTILSFFPLLIIRILAPVEVAMNLYVRSGDITNCTAVQRTAYICLSFINASAMAIFVIRTIAVRRAGTLMETFLWLWPIGGLAIWLTWAGSQWTDTSPRNPFAPHSSVCNTPHGVADWHALLWVYDFTFDLVIVALTLWAGLSSSFGSTGRIFSADKNESSKVPDSVKPSLVQRWQTMSESSRTFFLDALLYFMVSFTVNLAQMVWFLNNRHGIYGALVIPIQIWVNTTVAPRVILNLRLVQQPVLVTYANSSSSSRSNVPLQTLGSANMRTQNGSNVSGFGQTTSMPHAPGVFVQSSSFVVADSNGVASRRSEEKPPHDLA